MFGQSLLSAFGIACTTDTDQLFNPTSTQINSTATYQLNNATTSIPSNTYPGTASNITYAAGKFGNAAVFNGSSSYILASAFMPTGSAARSVSAWVKTTVSNTNMTILMYGSGGTNNYFIFRILNGKLGIAFYANDHDFTATGLTDGNWHHAVATYDGSSAKVYLDGSLIGTGSAGAVSTNSNNVAIGGYSNGVDALFNGSIDQVRIFNTALSQAAVTALYNETTTTAQNAYITEEVYNGIAYYKMSDATDQLGNYNGTATNVNFNTEGKFGFAGAFNGSSSYISASIPFLNARVTSAVSLWIKYTDTGAYRSVFNDYSNNANFNHNIIVNQPSTGNLRFFSAYGGNTGYKIIESSGLTLNDGNWHHIVSTVDLSTNTLTGYVDGVSVGNVTVSTNAWTGTTQNLQIGRQEAGAYFNGSIDQIRIYNSALSAADVSKLYKEIECEPVAINALDHFNTVLYTGNSSTQNITGVGFEPNLVWIKRRNTTEDHALFDSVRGALKMISSNLTTAEYTTAAPYEALSSFDSDGFTTGDNGATNRSPNNYVAWNWKAPLANLSSGFNGSSSYISTGQINFGANNISVSLWVHPNSSQNAYANIIDYNHSSSGGWTIQQDNTSTNSYKVSVYNGSSYNATSAFSLTANQWNHVVFTVTSAGAYNVYVDNGTPITGTGLTGLSTSTNNNLNIGRWYTGTSRYWGGKLDQVRIFNTALSASEVSDLYAEPAASNNTLNYPAGAGCIAAYPLQTDAVDLSGNYNGASSNVTFGQPGYLTQNTEGTTTSTVAANQEAGFSIVKYTGTGSNASFGHGLSSLPELVIVKRTNATEDWFVLYDTTNTPPNYMKLNTTSAGGTSSGVFPSPATSTVVNVGNDTSTNSSGSTYIAYCFKSIPGYSKIGSYIGTGATGNIQYVGFEPSFVMVKATSTSEPWFILDNKRDPNNPRDNRLMPDSSAAESTGSVHTMNFNSNNFTLNGTVGNGTNGNGQTYIYLAIA